MELPTYIKAREGKKIAQRALENIATGRGPHLSIKGNRFAFVDAVGNRKPVDQLFVDIIVVDANDHMSKLYYEGEWSEDANAPPTCFSDNGVGPSMHASAPPANRCDICPMNVWGSKINNVGNAVKACRDEQKLAFIAPAFGKMLFGLTVPPNSLMNWKTYIGKFVNQQFDVCDLLTRVSFVDGKQGTLQFVAADNPWFSEQLAALVNEALNDKGRDLIVGRLDRPRQGALPVPQEHAQAQVAQQAPPIAPAASPQSQTAFGGGFGTTQSAPDVMPGFNPQAFSGQAQATAPVASQPTTGKGRGRPKAARQEAPPAQAAPPTSAPFGIGAGVAPDSGMMAGINDVFGS